MNQKNKFWQWPNLLAIDASAIAAAWLWVLAREQSAHLSNTAYAVLALSVWLTYVADRLFDASLREEAQLLSTRHKFAKRNMRTMWCIWIVVLFLNILLAMTGLSQPQLQKGFALLIICLSYTGLNHLLSKRFFPKELLVALIFAGGTQVFLPTQTEWTCLAGFTVLCLINCLIIGWKEASIDASLKVRAISSILNARWIYLLLISGIGLSLYSDCLVALLPTMLCLSLIHLRHERFSQESFRVLCDGALFIGPLLYLFLSGVLVR